MVYPLKNRFGYNRLPILIAEHKHHHKHIALSGKHITQRAKSHPHHRHQQPQIQHSLTLYAQACMGQDTNCPPFMTLIHGQFYWKYSTWYRVFNVALREARFQYFANKLLVLFEEQIYCKRVTVGCREDELHG